MASPIHKYLFSPPPSPPSLPSDHASQLRSPALTSLKSLLPPDLSFSTRRQSFLDGPAELKARSPRTPQSSRFTLDAVYPTLPSRHAGKESFVLTVTDAPDSYSLPTSPGPAVQSKDEGCTPANIPTTTTNAKQPVSLALPRPLLRLLLLLTLLISSICIVVWIPSARLPSLRAASASRRLALSSDGRAYYDIAEPVSSWEDAKDRSYVPPQVFAGRLDRRNAVLSAAAQRVSVRK